MCFTCILSSLHYSIFLSFFSFSYSWVYYWGFELSIYHVIVVQKSSTQERKFTLYRWDYSFPRTLWAATESESILWHRQFHPFPGTKGSQWLGLSPYSRRQIPFFWNSTWNTNVGIRWCNKKSSTVQKQPKRNDDYHSWDYFLCLYQTKQMIAMLCTMF